MAVVFALLLGVVGEACVEHIADGFAVAIYGVAGGGLHAVGGVFRLPWVAGGRGGELAWVCGLWALVMLVDEMADGGIVCAGGGESECGD